MRIEPTLRRDRTVRDEHRLLVDDGWRTLPADDPQLHALLEGELTRQRATLPMAALPDPDPVASATTVIDGGSPGRCTWWSATPTRRSPPQRPATGTGSGSRTR